MVGTSLPAAAQLLFHGHGQIEPKKHLNHKKSQPHQSCMFNQQPHLCTFPSPGTEKPKDVAGEIYIDRECVESKVDWMQSELNKIVRVMECKLALHH